MQRGPAPSAWLLAWAFAEGNHLQTWAQGGRGRSQACGRATPQFSVRRGFNPRDRTALGGAQERTFTSRENTASAHPKVTRAWNFVSLVWKRELKAARRLLLALRLHPGRGSATLTSQPPGRGTLDIAGKPLHLPPAPQAPPACSRLGSAGSQGPAMTSGSTLPSCASWPALPASLRPNLGGARLTGSPWKTGPGHPRVGSSLEKGLTGK